jgi:hypothetical protein
MVIDRKKRNGFESVPVMGSSPAVSSGIFEELRRQNEQLDLVKKQPKSTVKPEDRAC